MQGEIVVFLEYVIQCRIYWDLHIVFFPSSFAIFIILTILSSMQ